jgi:hypothetical protein
MAATQTNIDPSLSKPATEPAEQIAAEAKEVAKKLTEKQKEAIKKYGDVPVIYQPTKSMLRPPADPGLTTLIENAMTVNEVKNLLKKGETDYKNAKPKTVKWWRKVAEKRIGELTK